MDDVEIDSIHCYDFRRARLSAALRWILNAAYGPDIPAELREPLPLKDRDTVTAIYVNTGLVSLLINCKLYLEACCNLFPQLSSTWKQGSGHWSIIQGLSRLGVYVEDDNGQVITEVELVQTNPFHLTAHVTLIESLMIAYSQTVADTNRIVQQVKAIGPFNASEDLPIDYEDALLVWMNKVCAACIKHAQEKGRQQLAHLSTVKVSKKQLTEITAALSVQPMEDILKDISDGCSLSILISFYCPKQLKLSDIHIAQTIGIGDSLHNISLVKTFCDNHLPVRIFNFSYEDILYTTDTIKPSLLAFLSQLFHYLVIQPLDIVSPPIISNNNYNQAVKTIPPPSLAATNSNQCTAFVPISATQHVNGPQDLISNLTKKSFQPSPSSSRLSDHSDFGSNPSLNTSGKLLRKRSSQTAENSGMHDTLSPIVVRKSQSMGILNNSSDPKQSLVAWESKSYYIDRSSKPPNRVSNGSPGLLSNVSFSEDVDEEEPTTPATASSLTPSSSSNEFQRRQPRTRTTERPKSSCNMNYQKLLDRSNDLESPLKLFAQKHGFSLLDKSATNDTAGGDHCESPSPVDVTSIDLTKVTPRSDSPTLNSEHRNGTSLTGQSYVVSTALTEEGAHAAGLPIIPDDSAVADSCTEVTFTSITDNDDNEESSESPWVTTATSTASPSNGSENSSAHPQLSKGSPRERAESPIQPIVLYGDNTDSSITSFAGMASSRTSDTQMSRSLSASTRPSSGLKQRFELQKTAVPEAKPSKKTTFSLNHTTWSDHARSKTTSDGDSDSQSETSDASGDRKPFLDVKILLEEKRKAMEKKKTLEDMERAKEVDNTSRQAFLKAVARNKGQQEQNNNRSPDPLNTFSRSDISKSIGNLQSKWQQDEISNAKRVAATTSAKSINVTAAPLDNITEVTESMEVVSPSVPLPSASMSDEKMVAGARERRSSSIDLHEAPVDVQQYGLEKLNESLTELRGEMKRLSHEQMRIDELQSVINTTRPQSRSTPHSKSVHLDSTLDTPSTALSNSPQSTELNTDRTLRISDLDKSTPPDTIKKEIVDTTSKISANKSLKEEGEGFSRPSSHSMTQSTEEPFILHKNSSSKVNKSAQMVKGKTTGGDKLATASSSKDSSKETPRRSSNGFLSSSQLSRKKASNKETPEPPAATGSATPTDQSSGRRKWSADNTPLFPGYDDSEERVSVKREPLPQQDHPIFQPPPDMTASPRTPQKGRRSSKRLQVTSPEDTPMREARESQQRVGSEGLEIRQLPGHQLPLDLSMGELPSRDYSDTPAREMAQHFQPLHPSTDPQRHAGFSENPVQPTPTPAPRQQNLLSGVSPGGDSMSSHTLSLDTPMRQPFYRNENRQYTSYDDVLDTPMRPAVDTPMSHAVDTPMHSRQHPRPMIETYSNEQLHNASLDSPMRDPFRSNQIFYSPPTRDVKPEPAERDNSAPLAQKPQAVSRHGTSTIAPFATSRHGSIPTDHPLGSSSNALLGQSPYEYAPTTSSPAPHATYKLNTPYGNAENEIKPADTTISLSSAMDAIRNDMIRQHNTEPAPNSNTPFGMLSQSIHNQSPLEQPQLASNQVYRNNQSQGLSRRVSSGSSDMEGAFADVSSTHSHTSAPTNPVHDFSPARASSADNEDRASVHSYGSGSLESGEGTPRNSAKPKRATWDMTTPRGDVLNQPGVGFIVAEQSQPTEEELRKRKEKVITMQLKRREEQEQKKHQKAAELAAKAETARLKDQESERKKLEEKAKKETILQEFQFRKAEDELPPEMRATFRQKPKRNERPASIHWAGSSADEHLLRGSDNLDTATSFTVSLGSGNLTHRRPISPANSTTAGSLSSRSKVSSRPTFEAPPDEYTGPKLYVKPSSKQKSNRTIIINAVSHCCLAGVVNTDNKNKVLEEIARSDGKHFLILFRDGNQTYKAVYSYEPDSAECTKIHGQGPKYIKDDMCHRFYKYNSGGKKFTEVLSTKHLSVSIDAITIHNHLWQKKSTAMPSRR